MDKPLFMQWFIFLLSCNHIYQKENIIWTNDKFKQHANVYETNLFS